ncbi:MAG: hypothetical protein ACTSQP_00570 [Promethearchaeota archaeon]
MTNRYILNEFEEIELFLYVYNFLKESEGVKDIEKIEILLDIRRDIILRIIKFMSFLEIIEKREEKYHVKEIQRELISYSFEHNLKLYILKKFREKTGNYPNWEKNAVLLLIGEYFFDKSRNLIYIKDKNLITDINKYFIQRNYKPLQQREKKIIQLNSNKFKNWAHIFTYLGFLVKVSDNIFIFNIDPDLIFSLIIKYSIKIRNNFIPLRDFLSWINNNYFLLPVRNNNIPLYFSKTLYYLCKQKRIELLKSGDTPIMNFSNIPQYLGISSIINSIKLNEM